MENPNRTRTGSQLLCCPHPSPVWSRLHPTPYIILNPAIPDTGPADYYYPTQETDKVLVIMGPSSAFLLTLIGVAFILIHAQPAANTECPENQEFNGCGSDCPANCSHPDPPEMCNRKCKIGCFCKKGFLDNGYGGCVPEEECRACTGNRTYGCGSAPSCVQTCSNRKELKICTMQCVFGCICKPDYVLLSEDDKTHCVLTKDCPQ
ncbi:mucin-5B-like isoform X6 [Rana temporaria]|uniref:mucin-5B-like isoform X6 n=1 Tax=Rana temporaria TaxID=8407 RepID=UPI001AADFEA2|nr:mucin-5B-like isoform X6 [Rana temporaria]